MEDRPAEPPRADARAKVPPKELAELDNELGEIAKRIRELPNDPDGKESLEGLNAERSRISKDLADLRTEAGEQWEAARDRLRKALRQLTERLDRLEKSESAS